MSIQVELNVDPAELDSIFQESEELLRTGGQIVIGAHEMIMSALLVDMETVKVKGQHGCQAIQGLADLHAGLLVRGEEIYKMALVAQRLALKASEDQLEVPS